LRLRYDQLHEFIIQSRLEKTMLTKLFAGSFFALSLAVMGAGGAGASSSKCCSQNEICCREGAPCCESVPACCLTGGKCCELGGECCN
jgi:hypothetical protein